MAFQGVETTQPSKREEVHGKQVPDGDTPPLDMFQ
jgi:hypothetical protein